MATLTYGLTAQENLLALFIAKNPSLEGILPEDVTFSVPTEDLTLTGGRNTKVTMTAVEGSDFTNSKELSYRRLYLTEIIGATPGATVNDWAVHPVPVMVASAPTQAELLTLICQTYNLPEALVNVQGYEPPQLETPGTFVIFAKLSDPATDLIVKETGNGQYNYVTFSVEIDFGNLALTSGELDGFDPYVAP